MIGRSIASVIRGYIWATPAHPGRGLLGKLAWRLDPREIIHEVVPGTKLRLTTNNDEHIEFWTNRYEEHGELPVFLNLLSPGMIVFDIGSNIGMYSCAIANVVGPEGRVFAFEPVPHIFGQLVGNIALNGATNVSADCLALSDRQGIARFHVGAYDSIGSLVRPSAAGSVIEVATTTADAYLKSMGVEQVHAVKIDVEGAELRVLHGMTGILSSPQKPILLVEHNHSALKSAGTSAEELFETILAYGYRPHAIRRHKLLPVTGLIEPSHRYVEPVMNYVFLPE